MSIVFLTFYWHYNSLLRVTSLTVCLQIIYFVKKLNCLSNQTLVEETDPNSNEHCFLDISLALRLSFDNHKPNWRFADHLLARRIIFKHIHLVNA
jgi:hypothetical protein